MLDISLGQLGSGSTLLALAAALYGAVAGVVGALRRDARLQTSARLAPWPPSSEPRRRSC